MAFTQHISLLHVYKMETHHKSIKQLWNNIWQLSDHFETTSGQLRHNFGTTFMHLLDKFETTFGNLRATFESL